MTDPTISRVAIVGTGVIGRSWAYCFAKAGCIVHIYDRDVAARDRAIAWATEEGMREVGEGTMSPLKCAALVARMVPCADLSVALQAVGYVQESLPEDLDLKRAVFRDLLAHAADSTIIASSTSALDIADIVTGLGPATRCTVAHPTNPPHVVPLVEVLPAPDAASDTVPRTCDFLRSVGQIPVLLRRYVPGFLLNRLQAALLREAVSLFENDVADADAIDAVVRHGLGLRWALMGPFAVADMNADNGIGEYLARYGPAYVTIMNDLGGTPVFTSALTRRLENALEGDRRASCREETRAWRDRLIRLLRSMKRRYPAPTDAANAQF